MAKYLTTDTLIDSIKRRAMLPSTQNTFVEEDFLAFLNEEVDLGVVPLILTFHEDYLLYTEPVKLESGIVRYPIPERATGNKLREISYTDSSGTIYEMTRIPIEDVPFFQWGNSYNSAVGTAKYYIEGNDIVLVSSPQSTIDGTLLVSYYMRPNELVPEDQVARITSVDYNNGLINVDSLPANFTGDSVFDITSSRSPHKLAAKDIVPTQYATSTVLTFTFGIQQILSATIPAPAAIVDTSYLLLTDRTSALTLNTALWFDKTGASSAPSVPNYILVRVDISAATTANDVAIAIASVINLGYQGDILADVAGANLIVKNAGQGISVGNNFDFTAGNTTITITVNQQGSQFIPRHIGKNDVFALSGQTIIPQFPLELHAMLAQRAAMRCLEALGDREGLMAAAAKLAEMEIKTGAIIDNRVEGSPQKVTNRHSFLNYSRRPNRNGW